MIRHLRRPAAWLGILALVFAQLAVAAYACPAAGASLTLSAPVAALPCDKMDPEQSNLCDRHCNDSQQSQSAASSILGGFIPAFAVVVYTPTVGVASKAVDRAELTHSPPVPTAIRNCCFRI